MRVGLRALALWAAATLPALAGPLMPVQVQPSGAEVPANLLRLSLVFAQPVAEPVLPRLALRRADGSLIELPFLEQELWSPSGRILTVLLHPGRVKSGLIAHDTAGPVLHADDAVVLSLDGREIKRWRVGADDHRGPVPAAWRLGRVHAGTRDPLVVELDEPIDGRDLDYLAVADARGARVAGSARLDDGERRWRFVPARPWTSGAHVLAVFSQLEDASGNRMGGRFEEATGTPASVEDAALPFIVR